MFYDPIGLLQLILINLNRLFQESCKKKFRWDEILSEDFKKGFKKIVFSLQDMGKIFVTRNILPEIEEQLKIELHGFSDASLQIFGACVYQAFRLVVFPSSKVRRFSETLGFREISLSFVGNWSSFA